MKSKASEDTVYSEPFDAVQDRLPDSGSLWTVYLGFFMVTTNYLIIVPTAPTYAETLGAGPEFSGVMVAAVPGASLIMAFPIHWYIQRYELKPFLFIGSIVSILGNILYCCAGLTHSKYTILVSRLLCGSMNMTQVLLAYVSRTSGLRQRSKIMMWVSVWIAAGYAAGPFLAFLIIVFCTGLRIDNLILDESTMPGWVMASLWLAYLIWVFFNFKEADPEPQIAIEDDECKEEFPTLAVASLMFTTVSAVIVMGAWETFTSILCKSKWGWSENITAIYMSAVICILIPVSYISGTPRFTNRFSDRTIILFFSITGIFSCVFLFDILPELAEKVMFTMTSVLMWTAAQLVRGFAMSLVTKIVPYRWKIRMTLFLIACMCIGRTAGPMIGSYLPQNWYAAISLMLMTLSAMSQVITYKQMIMNKKAR